jgi:hypothetical protein
MSSVCPSGGRKGAIATAPAPVIIITIPLIINRIAIMVTPNGLAMK